MTIWSWIPGGAGDLQSIGHYENNTGAGVTDLNCTNLGTFRAYLFDFYIHNNNAAALLNWWPNGANPGNTAGTMALSSAGAFVPIANEIHLVGGHPRDRIAGQLVILNGDSVTLAKRRAILQQYLSWNEVDIPPALDMFDSRSVWRSAVALTSWTLHSTIASIGVGSYIDVWGIK